MAGITDDRIKEILTEQTQVKAPGTPFTRDVTRLGTGAMETGRDIATKGAELISTPLRIGAQAGANMAWYYGGKNTATGLGLTQPDSAKPAQKQGAGVTPQKEASNKLDVDLAAISKDAAAQREALYQSEAARAKKMYGVEEARGAGPKYGGDVYENVDLRGGTATIYGNKPVSPYSGLSPESQALIKEMNDRGLSPGNYADTVSELIRAEKGEIGATERTRLGLTRSDKSDEMEQKKLDFEMRKYSEGRDLTDPRNFYDLINKYAKTKEVSVEDPNNAGVTTKQVVLDTEASEKNARRLFPNEANMHLGPEKPATVAPPTKGQIIVRNGVKYKYNGGNPKENKSYEVVK